jgi:cystatin-C
MASLFSMALPTAATLSGFTAPRHSRLVLSAGGAPKPGRQAVLFGAGASVRSRQTLSAAVSGTARAETGGLVGGFNDIPDVLNNTHVQNLGKWAVEEHNKEAGDNLEFGAVVQGQSQIVDGVNYHLVIQCMDSLGAPFGKYLAFVFEPVIHNGQLQKPTLLMFKRLLM